MASDWDYKEMRRERDEWQRLAESRGRLLKKRNKLIAQLKKGSNG